MSHFVRALVAVLAINVSIPAQEPPAASNPGPPKGPGAPPPEAAKRHDLHVFALKNAVAADAAQLLNELFGGRGPAGAGIRVVADRNTNSLLVQAAPADLETIHAVLARIDVARPDETGKLSVFPLKGVEPDNTLVESLNLLTGGGRRFTVDRQRKLVIAYCPPDVATRIETLLDRLENQAARPPASDVRVRVVWLMNIPAKDDPKDETAAPPADLKGILPELAKLGIDRPRLAAQMLVNATPGTEFRAAGRAALAGECPISVSGRYTDKGESPILQIVVRATRTPTGGPAADLGNVSTSISAPIGHMVVLGVTPTDTNSSVFIVQVLRPAP